MKTLKHLTEGFFDADDVLDEFGKDAFINAEWKSCFPEGMNEYRRKSYINEFVVKLDGSTLTITHKKKDGGTTYFDISLIENLCEKHKIKKIIWEGDYICFECTAKKWSYPITFVIGSNVSIWGNYGDIEFRNIKIEGESLDIPHNSKFNGGCELDLKLLSLTKWDDRKRFSCNKIVTDVLDVKWVDFPFEMNHVLGRIKSEKDTAWSRYIMDIKMPHRKGVFYGVEFEDMDSKKAIEIIKNGILENSKNIKVDTLLVYFKDSDKWFTIRIVDDKIDICKGYYAASYFRNKIEFEVRV